MSVYKETYNMFLFLNDIKILIVLSILTIHINYKNKNLLK